MSEPVVITRSRLSYPNLFTPKTMFNGVGAPKYSVTALIPKSDAESKALLDAAINQAYQEGCNDSKLWTSGAPQNPGITLYDGDAVTPKGEAWGEECRGHWVLRASSVNPPKVMDAACELITDQNKIYGGCYAAVLVHFYPYDTAGNRGIGCGLDGVQKLEDGEPFGGRVDAAKYFTPKVQPAFGQQAQPVAPGVPPYNPGAPVAVPALYPQQAAPQYPAAAAQPIDPITGKPVVGNVMGL